MCSARAAGIRRQPISATNATPATAQTSPTGVKSNMPNGAPSASPRNVATTMLGGVPIKVTMPPRIEAKDRGIRVNAGLRLALAAASRSTGMSSASAATLFMIAESAADTPAMIAIWAKTGRAASTTRLATSSTTPAFDSPRLMISTSATTTVAGCPKPLNASPAGTTSATNATTSAPNATRS